MPEMYNNVCEWLDCICLTSRSIIVQWYGNVTIVGEGGTNLDICSALTAFDQGKYSSCYSYTCCDTGPRLFRSHPKGHPFSRNEY